MLAFGTPMFFAGCGENASDEQEIKTYEVKGFAQKGPYIVGSDVTVAELNDDLTPTGRVFFATILSDDGYFEVPHVELSSRFVLIKVDGDYYNEAHDGFSIRKLTMYSLADISEGNEININLLTHLQRKRIEHLVQEENMSFGDAKEQAYEELLTVFSLQSFNPSSPEHINILEDNASSAILLTVSSIISHLVNEYDGNEYAQWLEMLTNFQEDLADNGVLDDGRIGSKLLATAGSLNVNRIVNDMQDEFEGSEIPDFSPYINHFTENSGYVNYFEGLFPEADGEAINILNLPDGTTLSPENTYVIRIELPELTVPYYMNIGFHEVKQQENSGEIFYGGDFWQGEGQDDYIVLSPQENSNITSINVPVTFTGTGKVIIDFDIYMDGVNRRPSTIQLFW